MTAKKSASDKAPSGARSALDLESAQEVGFLGYEVDPTDDSHYSVAGVLAGKPTPETDEKAAAAAKEGSK